jgi:hypothetical protein
MESLSRRGANCLAGIDSDLACGAICIACIHSDHTHASCAASQMFPAHDDGRRCDTVAGKHGSSARGSIGDGNRKIGLAARFNSSLYGRKAKAQWQRFIRDEG